MKPRAMPLDLRCQTDAQIGRNSSKQARPRGFEPLTFGSVDRGSEAYIWLYRAKSCPTSRQKVAKKSISRPFWARRPHAATRARNPRAGASSARGQTTASRPWRASWADHRCARVGTEAVVRDLRLQHALRRPRVASSRNCGGRRKCGRERFVSAVFLRARGDLRVRSASVVRLRAGLWWGSQARRLTPRAPRRRERALGSGRPPRG